MTQSPPVVRLQDVRQHYGATQALAGITLDVPAGRMVGLIGPDGVGKSSLLSLIAGARAVQAGEADKETKLAEGERRLVMQSRCVDLA